MSHMLENYFRLAISIKLHRAWFFGHNFEWAPGHRCLDTHQRMPGNVADVSLSGRSVARGLDLLITAGDKPKTIISDKGTELTGNAILSWLAEPSRLALYQSHPFLSTFRITKSLSPSASGYGNPRPLTILEACVSWNQKLVRIQKELVCGSAFRTTSLKTSHSQAI